MKENDIISITKAYVKEELSGAEGGHDYFHIMRVYNNAMNIYKKENNPGNLLVIQLGALLHDIADAKFYDGDETVGPKKAKEFLQGLEVSPEIVDHVVNIIKYISFRGSNDKNKSYSIEFNIVQDADRLDAMGAMAIARTFSYGGYIGSEIHNPNKPPRLNQTNKDYKGSSTSINHFYEKLLLLKDRMNTNSGRIIAQERHIFMEKFLEQFYAEWDGKL